MNKVLKILFSILVILTVLGFFVFSYAVATETYKSKIAPKQKEMISSGIYPEDIPIPEDVENYKNSYNFANFNFKTSLIPLDKITKIDGTNFDYSARLKNGDEISIFFEKRSHDLYLHGFDLITYAEQDELNGWYFKILKIASFVSPSDSPIEFANKFYQKSQPEFSFFDPIGNLLYGLGKGIWLNVLLSKDGQKILKTRLVNDTNSIGYIEYKEDRGSIIVTANIYTNKTVYSLFIASKNINENTTEVLSNIFYTLSSENP